MIRSLLMLCTMLSVACLHAGEPPQVVIVGTYHFSNPGQDLSNVEAVDVTTASRQAELQAVTNALAKFEPTLVAVEWTSDTASSGFASYQEGNLPTSADEAIQIGFRLAKQRGLERVHGIDVRGEFPFADVQAWAAANGKADELAAMLEQAHGITGRITALQASHSIGGVLHEINTPQAIDESHTFYTRFLGFGKDDEQPGVALNAAWEKRNLGICARLLQLLRPGDRAVVLYGQGHVYLLQRCIREMPGVELVEANAFLPAG
jgi:hypothetical protein